MGYFFHLKSWDENSSTQISHLNKGLIRDRSPLQSWELYLKNNNNKLDVVRHTCNPCRLYLAKFFKQDWDVAQL
jgi:hypothetical protein